MNEIETKEIQQEVEIQHQLEFLLWEMEVMINQIKELNNVYRCGSGDYFEVEKLG